VKQVPKSKEVENMKKSRKLLAIALCAVIVASIGVVVAVRAEGGSNRGNNDDARHRFTFDARLNGFQQVPAIITNGTGTFRAELNPDGRSIFYTLSYFDLGSTVHFAHIHVGQAGANGGVIVFLCGGGGKPECPASGSVSGTLTSMDVMAIADQGVKAGNFDELLIALRFHVAYVNVHTTNFPSGEIRGQIFQSHEEDDD
jgi:hypothetical protein